MTDLFEMFSAQPLTSKELAEFESLLRERRSQVMEVARGERAPDARDLAADELDQAIHEYQDAFDQRLRHRSQALVKKLDRALERLAAGEYDECEDCGDMIGKKRLLARPEATLCISCKEEQERLEAGFLKRRLRNEDTPFFTF